MLGIRVLTMEEPNLKCSKASKAPQSFMGIRDWSMTLWASLVAQVVKNLSAVLETRFRSLSWEDPLEKGMATSPVFLPGEFHGQRSLAGYSPCGCKESDTTE